VAEAYRKVRNTCRYLLSNLYDFDPGKHAVKEADLDELDRYALHRHRQVVGRILEAYREYEFHLVYHQLVQYCVADLSSFYLDVLKDRLYCDAPDGARRRSAQTVLHRIALDLTRLLAPVLPFTADEVWPLVPGAKASVHEDLFPKDEPADTAVLDRWEAMLGTRAVVTKALEEARAAKVIASSLEAAVEVRGPMAALAALRDHDKASTVFPGNVANLMIVSKATLVDEDGPVTARVSRAAGSKCERCWTYSLNVGKAAVHPGVCERCASVLEAR